MPCAATTSSTSPAPCLEDSDILLATWDKTLNAARATGRLIANDTRLSHALAREERRRPTAAHPRSPQAAADVAKKVARKSN